MRGLGFLAKDKVPLSGVHPHLIQKFADGLLSGAVAVHEDQAQEMHLETGLGESAGTLLRRSILLTRT